MRISFFYGTNLVLALSVFCFLAGMCLAQNKEKKTEAPAAIKSEDEAVDPTMLRASVFIGKKPPEAFENYQRLAEEFTKDLAWEDRVAFNIWHGGIMSPLFTAAWEKEWKEHPESHVAFALYIRDEVKKNKHLRSVEELSPTVTDDEKLFYNYLNFRKQGARKGIQEQNAIEERLHIPNELKTAAQNPEAYLFVGSIYTNYVTAQSNRALEGKWKQEEAVASAARKAIVPVDRNSREYQDAFLAYKQAVENEEQVILLAQKNDPTWARSRDLLETQGLGTVAVVGAEEKKFVESLDDTKRTKFNQWKDAFTILASIDATEKEWKEEPDSHPAILFYTNIAQARVRSEENGKVFDQSSVDLKEMLGGDGTTLEKFVSSLKQSNAESLAQMDSLEKVLGISSKLKDAMNAGFSDSTLFLFYDTYYRIFTPDTVNKAGREVSDAIDKLNLLRPDWAAEENIEFSSEISKVTHQFGLNDRGQWTWQRLFFLSVGGLLILFGVFHMVKKYLSRRRASK